MKRSDIQLMSTKDKNKIVRAISNEYKRALIYVKQIDQRTINKLSDKAAKFCPEIAKRKEQINLVAIIDSVIHLMTPTEKELILNEFINQEESNWWIQFYSKSTYYNLKKQAVDNFTYYLLV